MHYDPRSIKASYDTLSNEYIARISDELIHKPLDRMLLRRVVETATEVGDGPLCDFGCGPGHIGEYLRMLGGNARKVYGVDISSKMITNGRQKYREIEFFEADFRSLPFENHSLVGGVAFYSLIHLLELDFNPVLKEFRRVLAPGAPLVASFHLGTEALHVDELWGLSVSLDYKFYTPAELRSFFNQAGFIIEDILVRDPYEGFEHPSTRCYIVVRA